MIKYLKSSIKEALLKMLHVPYSSCGLPVVLLPYLKKGDSVSVVDIGAHRGDFIKKISRHTNISRAILVEPIPDLARNLTTEFADLGYSVFNCAISDSIGNVEFEVNEAAATSSLLKINRNMPELSAVNLGKPQTIEVETRTLDEVICEAGLDKVNLLKIDVQGAEHLVLQGGTETLGKTSLVWIEVSFKPLYEKSCTFFEIYEMLNSYGFILKAFEPAFLAPDGELVQSDALFVKKGD